VKIVAQVKLMPDAAQVSALSATLHTVNDLANREARHVRNTNHIIAMTIVTEAERTGRGLALEELKGIRTRVRLRKPWGYRPAEGWGRGALHSWAFAQLAHFITYKARRAGVPLAWVDRLLLDGMRPVRARRPAKPYLPGQIRMPVVRRRCARRPQRLPRPRP
jgi:IS605 OrfB family transposase